jgi:membrane protein
MFAQLRQRLHALIWDPHLARTPVLRAFAVTMRHAEALIREVMTGQLTLRAMSLVYTTLMSLVPLLAFSFSLLQGAGVHRQLQPILENFLAPLGEEQSIRLTQQIIAFVDNMQGTLLGGVGLVFLIFIVVSMVQKVEASMNYIWRVENARSLPRKFSGYLSAMLLGPLVMALAVGLIAAISGVTLVQRLLELQPLDTAVVAIGWITPYAVLTVIFTLIYMLLPNTRVKPTAALIGGLFGGVAWAVASSVFALFAVEATRIMAIYSSFAIVILALIWLYVSWLILLLGAQLAYFVQNPEQLRTGRVPPQLSALAREHVGLALMLMVARQFLEPEQTWRERTMAARFHVAPGSLAPVLESLREAGLLQQTGDGRLLPGRSLDTIRLVEVLGAVRGNDEILPRSRDPWSARALQIWQQADEAVLQRFGDVTLADIVHDEDRQATNADAER